MAKRKFKRDRRGRFAKTATRATNAVPAGVVAGSRRVRVGRVGGGELAGITASVELKPRAGSARYLVSVTAGRKIAR